MIIQIPIPMNLSSRGAQGVQLEPLQITQITEKREYGSFTNHKKYDVIYIDATNNAFLIKDDENDAVWVDFNNCKIV